MKIKQGYRDTEMLKRYRATEIQRYRDTELQSYRDTEVQRYRDTEVQRYRDIKEVQTYFVKAKKDRATRTFSEQDCQIYI